MTKSSQNFTAQDVVSIIEAGSKAKIEHLHLSGPIDLFIQFTPKPEIPVETSLHVDRDLELPLNDADQPNFDEAALMFTDPEQYEDQVPTEG